MAKSGIMQHMADFINLKEIPKNPVDSGKEDNLPEQEIDLEQEQRQTMPEGPENSSEQKKIERTGKVVPLREAIAEEKPATKTERQQDIERKSVV